MDTLIRDLRVYEEQGPRSNNYEHMLQMVPMPCSPESSLIATLSYIKQHPVCQTFTGAAELNNRSCVTRITQSLEWTLDQQVPYSVILTDNTGHWTLIAQKLQIPLVRVYVPTAAKHNLKLLQKEIDSNKPLIVLADYTQVSIIQKLLGQDKSVETPTTTEEDRYKKFILHATNPARTPEDTHEMDQIINENRYMKDCLLQRRTPVLISKRKVLAGSIPQRLIFDKSNSRAKLAIHSKCTWLVNPAYPLYGSYIRNIYTSITKSFALRDYFHEYLRLIPSPNFHDTASCSSNIHQLFLKQKMPIVQEPHQLTAAVARAPNRSLQQQMMSKRADPCPICMNDYSAIGIHSRVTFACCSAHCCNTCFEEMAGLTNSYTQTAGERLMNYAQIRCFMCRKTAGSNLILEVTNSTTFPDGFPNIKELLKTIDAQQIVWLGGGSLHFFLSDLLDKRTLILVPLVLLRNTRKSDFLQQLRVQAGLKGISDVHVLVY